MKSKQAQHTNSKKVQKEPDHPVTSKRTSIPWRQSEIREPSHPKENSLSSPELLKPDYMHQARQKKCFSKITNWPNFDYRPHAHPRHTNHSLMTQSATSRPTVILSRQAKIKGSDLSKEFFIFCTNFENRKSTFDLGWTKNFSESVIYSVTNHASTT